MRNSGGAADLPARRLSAQRRRALVLLTLATFFTMSVWFSASFIVSQLAEAWHLSTAESALLTIAVQAGFIIGTLGSAVTGLADALPGRHLMIIGAGVASVANLGILLAHSALPAFILRLATGIALALVYPPALKEISTWFRHGRGLALGAIIGALTVGSATPHLVLTIDGIGWRTVIIVTSAGAAAGALLAACLRRSGPYPFVRSRFRLSEALRSLRVRAVALADIGYMGHMWELYAMWTWIGVFIGTTLPLGPGPLTNTIAFAVIGIGAVGCLAGGVVSDHAGRAQSALASLVCSGTCAVALVFSAHYPAWLTIAVCLIWGLSVIADSAQFSAIVTEHAVQQFVGSALSLQLAAGYGVSMFTIWLVPHLADHYAWGIALGVLAIGPAIGSVAMWRCSRLGSAPAQSPLGDVQALP